MTPSTPKARLSLIRTALTLDPFATIRQIADETGLGETQITTAIRMERGQTLGQFRRTVHGEAFAVREVA